MYALCNSVLFKSEAQGHYIKICIFECTFWIYVKSYLQSFIVFKLLCNFIAVVNEIQNESHSISNKRIYY